METQTKKQKSGSWDILHSSYFWNIVLDPNFYDPTSKRSYNSAKVLTGYSKRVGESENQDKDLLLKRKIVNLYLNGYFKRSKYIEIFYKTQFAIDKNRDPKILILYSDHYDIPQLNHDVILKKYGHFLTQFYEFINQKKDVRALIPQTRKSIAKDEFLKVVNYNFKSIADLYSHAARCLTHGHAEGAVNHFISEYKRFKNW